MNPAKRADGETTNRRRAQRLPIQTDCEVAPKAPAWTLLPDPMPGKTVNVTGHGIRVVLPRFPLSRYEKWQGHLSRSDTIRVAIRLTAANGPLDLEGQIVWSHFEPQNNRSGECSIGILLALMDESAREQLAAVIDEMTE